MKLWLFCTMKERLGGEHECNLALPDYDGIDVRAVTLEQGDFLPSSSSQVVRCAVQLDSEPLLITLSCCGSHPQRCFF